MGVADARGYDKGDRHQTFQNLCLQLQPNPILPFYPAQFLPFRSFSSAKSITFAARKTSPSTYLSQA